LVIEGLRGLEKAATGELSGAATTGKHIAGLVGLSYILAKPGGAQILLKYFKSPTAATAAQVIRLAMLANRDGLRMGIPNLTLNVLHGDLPAVALRRHGVRIHMGTPVMELLHEGNRASGVKLGDYSCSYADYVVVATNPKSHPLLPPEMARTRKNYSAELRPPHVPIMTLYCWYQERIDLPPALCMPKGHFHWCFDKSGFEPRLPGMSSAVALVASAARDLVKLPDHEICAIALDELNDALKQELPRPSNWTVAKCPNATFSPQIGCDNIRPIQRTSLRNVFLAGDWTDTGWPGTMEGAVRSGYICARDILSMDGTCCPVPLPDLEAKGLSSLLPFPDERDIVREEPGQGPPSSIRPQREFDVLRN
jgi:hypothetical protein